MYRPFLVALVPSVLGVILALNAVAAPFGNTGVDGTLGAWSALVGATFVTLTTGVLMTWPPARPGWRVTTTLLAMLAAILTAIAALFLMQTLLAVAMVLTVPALGYAAAMRERTSP